MKRLLVVMALMLSALPLHARLGESGAELQKRFGPPAKQLKQAEQNLLVQNQYFNHDVIIYVTLHKDRSVVEHYLKLKKAPAAGEEPVIVPMPRDLAEAILQACSGGFQWRQMGETASDIRFARDDKKALAVLLKRDNIPVELRMCDANFVEHLIPPQNRGK